MYNFVKILKQYLIFCFAANVCMKQSTYKYTNNYELVKILKKVHINDKY